MISSIKNLFVENAINIPGWRSSRKIVVIESDDWGMIRMASKKSYEYFLKKGYKVDHCPYNKNDGLETNEDMIALFEVLGKIKDRKGNPAIFTANNIVANPDFKKIKDSIYNEYHFEVFTETLERESKRDQVFALYKEGITQKMFMPQFHGREHLNVNRWMKGLKENNGLLHDAFQHQMFTVYKEGTMSGRHSNLDAFGLGAVERWVDHKEVAVEGLNVFKEIWGFNSLSFIAPCYTWHPSLEPILASEGVKYLQGGHVQIVPNMDFNIPIAKKYHYTGQKNKCNQSYLIRNVHFEPVENPAKDSVGLALRQIKRAFMYNKPAVIGSHRVNYMGNIHEKNRTDNLIQLKKLLLEIVKNWPEVEFISSDQLGKIINNEN